MAFSLSAIYSECTHEGNEASEVARLRARRRASQVQGSHDAHADQPLCETERDPRFALTSFAWGPSEELKSLIPVCNHDDDLFAETSCAHCARKAHLKRVRKQRKNSTLRLGKASVSRTYMHDADVSERKRRKRGCATTSELRQGEIAFGTESQSSCPEVAAKCVGEIKHMQRTPFESLICVPACCRDVEKTTPTVWQSPRKEEGDLEELLTDPLIQDALEPEPCDAETFGGEILCDEMSNEPCNMDLDCLETIESRCAEMTPATKFNQSVRNGSASASCTPSDMAEEMLTPKVRFKPMAPQDTLATTRDECGERDSLLTPTRLQPKGRKRTARKRVKPSCGFSDDDSDSELRAGQDRRKTKMGKLAI